jgi:hypothetical protein
LAEKKAIGFSFCVNCTPKANGRIKEKRTMNQKENSGLIATKKGPVWNVKVKVSSVLANSSVIKREKLERWKIKVILN